MVMLLMGDNFQSRMLKRGRSEKMNVWGDFDRQIYIANI